MALTLDTHIKSLENENRVLMMSKSQCAILPTPSSVVLQNKHILEQQIDEVVKENSQVKSELTRLKLQLQVGFPIPASLRRGLSGTRTTNNSQN